MKPTYIHVIDTTACSITKSCFFLPSIPNIFTITFGPAFVCTTKRFCSWCFGIPWDVFVTSLIFPRAPTPRLSYTLTRRVIPLITTYSCEIWFESVIWNINLFIQLHTYSTLWLRLKYCNNKYATIGSVVHKGFDSRFELICLKIRCLLLCPWRGFVDNRKTQFGR